MESLGIERRTDRRGSFGRSGSGPGRTTLSRYFSDIREYRPLTREEERHLARDIQAGSASAANKLVTANLRFVVNVADDYRNLGIPFEDLLNEGNLGLIDAAQRFDPERNTKFITFAVWWIRKSIIQALRETARVVRVPESQIKRLREIRKVERNLLRVLHRKPTREEIAKALGQSPRRIDRIMRDDAYETSLETTVRGHGDATLDEILPDSRSRSPEARMLERETSTHLVEICRRLTEKQRTVILYRFGLGGERPQTLCEIGRRIGLCRERVRQIENAAKKRMRRFYRELGGIDPIRRASA